LHYGYPDRLAFPRISHRARCLPLNWKAPMRRLPDWMLLAAGALSTLITFGVICAIICAH
jgi:hypothetical protein